MPRRSSCRRPRSGAIIGSSTKEAPHDVRFRRNRSKPVPRGRAPVARPAAPANQVTFSRRELNRILDLYGRKVAAGEWRDYAIDFLKDRAVFSVFRRSSEVPLYRIEKNPKLARRQGAYSVISATGLIVRRGHELDRVLRSIDTFAVIGRELIDQGGWLPRVQARAASAPCRASDRIYSRRSRIPPRA